MNKEEVKKYIDDLIKVNEWTITYHEKYLDDSSRSESSRSFSDGAVSAIRNTQVQLNSIKEML